jgi:microcystin-dependent protein
MNKQDIINIIFAVSLIALFIFYMKCNRDNFAVCTSGCVGEGLYNPNLLPPNKNQQQINVPMGTIQNSFLSSDSNNNLSLVTSFDVPIGSIMMWASTDATTLPVGWLFCDGSNVTIGNTQYALPMICGKFVVGAGDGKNSGWASYDVGDLGGEEVHQLSIAELPAHNHPIYQNVFGTTSVGCSGSTEGVGCGITTGCGDYGCSSSYASLQYASSSKVGPTSPFIGNTGSYQAFNNMPPYYGLAFIIKVCNGPVSDTATVQGNGMNNST